MMPSRGPRRGWSRLDRVNESIREVVAEELAHIDDDRLQLVTITGVSVDGDLRRARVWFSALSVAAPIPSSEKKEKKKKKKKAAEPVVAVEEVLAEHRIRLQAAVAAQLRLKRTPEITFDADPAIVVGTRVESIIRGFDRTGFESTDSGDVAVPGYQPGQGGELT